MTREPAPAPAGPQPPTPFHDLDAYVALPRMSGLTLSPDGTRLVTAVSTLDAQRTRYVTALWEVDPEGVRPARRLTHSAKGESAARFAATGDLLFTSARPHTDAAAAAPDDEPPAALWLLPADGAEARVVAARKAGIDGVIVADDAPVVVLPSDVLPRATDDADDERLLTARTDAKVAAILHDSYPVRFWDHDLGPAVPHLFTADLTTVAAPPEAGAPAPRLALRDVTPDPGVGLRHQDAVLSSDGRTLVTSWSLPGARGSLRQVLVAVDVATGVRRMLVDDPAADVSGPVVSPDGSKVAYIRETLSAPDRAPQQQLWVADLDSAVPTPRRVAEAWDRWPHEVVWTRDSAGLLVQADDLGRGPVFHIALVTGAVTRVTADDAVFSDLRVSPDGRTLYAMRASYTAPAHPVRIDLSGTLAFGIPADARPLPAPAPLPPLPGTLTEVTATADDGSELRSWLVLPEGASAASPAPLLLWIHGGPLGSWNAWSWRWNPWIMAARGYAVLLPDPALSTGYGQHFVQRGWGAWGAAPFTDLMAVTEATVARADIDQTRTAAMGGSFGGYMANWVAGHTDRFRAIVTHASLWALDQFGPTTDDAFYWEREMTPAMALANSPHLSVDKIVTPMLVVHGDKDYRVPIGEGLRLWYELLSKSGLPADDRGRTPHRFLYFPDENHWVLSPQHAKVWYQVVDVFLAQHVLGLAGEELPEVLG